MMTELHVTISHSVSVKVIYSGLCLTIEAHSPDSSLLTVYGPEQMLRKLRSLRSGLRERHDRTWAGKNTTQAREQHQHIP